MAASKDRIDWALLLLRLSAGGYAILHGLGPLLHARGSITIPNAMRLGSALLETVCGGLLVVGVWTLPAAAALLAILGWPLIHGFAHGATLAGSAGALFRFLATLASGLGGPGKWSPSN
jgi:uncharacterized membrane protein YphA (DoxX/SURF4 family)